MRAMTAATRLTTDSAASESRPTDPVSRYAPAFSAMVTTAAAIDSHAYRSRPAAECSGSAPTCGNAIFFMAPPPYFMAPPGRVCRRRVLGTRRRAPGLPDGLLLRQAPGAQRRSPVDEQSCVLDHLLVERSRERGGSVREVADVAHLADLLGHCDDVGQHLLDRLQQPLDAIRCVYEDPRQRGLVPLVPQRRLVAVPPAESLWYAASTVAPDAPAAAARRSSSSTRHRRSRRCGSAT